MLKKNVFAMFLVILIAFSVSIFAFAEPVDNSDSAKNKVFEVFVSGENAISENVLYAEKIISTSFDFNGAEYDVDMWALKTDNSTVRIKLTSEDGKRADEAFCAAIKSCETEMSVNDPGHFEISFTDSDCTINNVLMISGAEKLLRNIKTYDGVTEKINEPQTGNTTDTISNIAAVSPSSSEAVAEDTNPKNNSNMAYWIVIAVLIIAIIVVLALFLKTMNSLKKDKHKDKDEETITVVSANKGKSKSKKQTKTKNEKGAKVASSQPSGKNTRGTKGKKSETEKAKDKDKEDSFDKTLKMSDIVIPEAENTDELLPPSEQKEPEVQEIVFDFNAMHDLIMSIYRGEAIPDDLTEDVLPLNVSNLTDFSIYKQQLCFEKAASVSVAKFLLVKNEYLYINYYNYNKQKFKAFTSITGIQSCFDISGELGKPITELKPGKVKKADTGFVLFAKGKITTQR